MSKRHSWRTAALALSAAAIGGLAGALPAQTVSAAAPGTRDANWPAERNIGASSWRLCWVHNMCDRPTAPVGPCGGCDPDDIIAFLRENPAVVDEFVRENPRFVDEFVQENGRFVMRDSLSRPALDQAAYTLVARDVTTQFAVPITSAP